MKVKLSKPLQLTSSKSVTELELQAPTLTMVTEIDDYPFTVTSSGEIKQKPSVLLKYLAKMTGVEPAILRQMAFTDFVVAGNAVINFLLLGEEQKD